MIVDTAITIAGIVFVILALSLSFAEKDKNDGQARLKRSQEHRKEKRTPQMKGPPRMIEGPLLDRRPDRPRKRSESMSTRMGSSNPVTERSEYMSIRMGLRRLRIIRGIVRV